jgi:hypothetical protein
VAALRASDADREVVQALLADAFADGRLDREEYDERSATTLGARTLGELPPLVSDLVPDRPLVSSRVPLVAASSAEIEQRALEHWQEERRNAFLGLVGSALVTWTIWAVVMFGGFPWPLFVNAFALMSLLRTVASKREIVASEVRRLEKKRAKELESRAKPTQGPDAAA